MAASGPVAPCDQAWAHPIPAPVWRGESLRRRLLGYARQLVGDEGEAEDLVQETLLRVGSGRARLRSGDRVEAWVFRICRHAAIDLLRRRRVRRHLWGQLSAEPENEGPGAVSPDPAPPGGGPRAAELGGLTAHQRVLVALHHVCGVPQPVLCRMAGLSPAALRVRLFRARRSLRARSRPAVGAAVRAPGRAGVPVKRCVRAGR